MADREREGERLMPDEQVLIDEAHRLLENRRKLGLERYGKLLTSADPRDFGVEADEELADWLIYWAGHRLRQRRLLSEAVKLIRISHGMHIQAAEEPVCWRLYYANAPEMAPIREVFGEDPTLEMVPWK